MLKRNRGITLIALVITIIVLLILTGITLSLVAGENGILKRATDAVKINEEAMAEEEANLVIADIVTKYYEAKYVNKENLKELDDYIKEQIGSGIKTPGGYIVSVTTEGKVQVSRNEKVILSGEIKNGKVEWTNENTGETTPVKKPEEGTVEVPSIQDEDIAESIEITTYMTIKSNTLNTLNLAEVEEVKYAIQNKTENISLNGNKLLANNNADSKDSCQILITGTYHEKSYTNNLTVFVEPKHRTSVTDKEGNNKEAFCIYTEQDLIRMQEIVNTGANNKCNAKLMNNIELNTNLYEVGSEGKVTFKETAKKYNSIGNVKNPFLGIFEGGKHTISGVCIKEDLKISGFFGVLGYDGEIKNLTLRNLYVGLSHSDVVYSGYTIGGLAGYNEGKIYRCKIQQSSFGDTGNIVGGLVGLNNGEIIECASLDVYLSSLDCQHFDSVGGIAGLSGYASTTYEYNYSSAIGKIYRCYSTGMIDNSIAYAGVSFGGIAGGNGLHGANGYVSDSYSKMKIGTTDNRGALVGAQSYRGYGELHNSYYLNLDCNVSVVNPKNPGVIQNSYSNDLTVTAKRLNAESDETVWIDDQKDAEGNWKYNNGYPILKWQIE